MAMWEAEEEPFVRLGQWASANTCRATVVQERFHFNLILNFDVRCSAVLRWDSSYTEGITGRHLLGKHVQDTLV